MVREAGGSPKQPQQISKAGAGANEAPGLPLLLLFGWDLALCLSWFDDEEL